MYFSIISKKNAAANPILPFATYARSGTKVTKAFTEEETVIEGFWRFMIVLRSVRYFSEFTHIQPTTYAHTSIRIRIILYIWNQDWDISLIYPKSFLISSKSRLARKNLIIIKCNLKFSDQSKDQLLSVFYSVRGLWLFYSLINNKVFGSIALKAFFYQPFIFRGKGRNVWTNNTRTSGSCHRQVYRCFSSFSFRINSSLLFCASNIRRF